MHSSNLSKKPKSEILKHGYINIYSSLSDQEKRALSYKGKYKRTNPGWDDTLVMLDKAFKKLSNKLATKEG
jgi:hypothetical protein